MPRSNPRLPVLSGLAFALGSVAIHSAALAQPVKPSSMSATAQPARQTRIARYAKALHLDAAQTDAAKDLYAVYQAQTIAAGKKMRDAMKDAQEQMNDGDRKAFMDQMGKTMRSQQEATRRITDSFLSDLRALLHPDQADRWPALERLRRREQYLGGLVSIGSAGAGIGGATTDLIPLIEKLSLPAEFKPKIDEQLDLYERDIDRPLQDRQHNADEDRKLTGDNGVQRFDGDSFAKTQERDHAVDMAVREVNTRYIRQIAALLPDDLARKLTEAYDGRAYRSIYKESSISRKMTAAQGLADLSAAQKQSLQAMIDRYKRDARAANDHWATAQKRAEDAGRPTGGGLVIVGPGGSSADKVDPDFAAARSARRTVDDSARDQLGQLLSPDQLAAIPQPPPSMIGGRHIEVFGNDGGGDVAFSGDLDISDDDDAGPPGGGAIVIMRTVEVDPGHGPEEAKPAPATPSDPHKP